MAAIRSAHKSTPIVSSPASAKATAIGSPAYPRPMMPTVARPVSKRSRNPAATAPVATCSVVAMPALPRYRYRYAARCIAHGYFILGR